MILNIWLAYAAEVLLRDAMVAVVAMLVLMLGVDLGHVGGWLVVCPRLLPMPDEVLEILYGAHGLSGRLSSRRESEGKRDGGCGGSCNGKKVAWWWW